MGRLTFSMAILSRKVYYPARVYPCFVVDIASIKRGNLNGRYETCKTTDGLAFCWSKPSNFLRIKVWKQTLTIVKPQKDREKVQFIAALE